MRVILKMKWLIVAIWLVAAIILMVSAPSMEQLVRTKGQITVPDGYSSTIASELEMQMNYRGLNTNKKINAKTSN